MIRFETIAHLVQSELVIGDLVEIFGETAEGDGAVITGRAVDRNKITANTLIQVANGVHVELFPSGRAVSTHYVESAINMFHTDDAITYSTNYVISTMTHKIKHEDDIYLPKYVPITTTTWDQDKDKFKLLPKLMTQENFNDAIVESLTENHQLIYAVGKEQFFSDMDSVKRDLIGSGLVNAGTNPAGEVVNDGLVGIIDTPNIIALGTNSRYAINGVIHTLSGTIKQPAAPLGTRVNNNGVVTDYLVDTDSRYGDVAANSREAGARAFEGLNTNGDFRKGDSSWVKTGSVTLTAGADTGTAVLGASSSIDQAITLVVGQKYITEVVVTAGSGTLTIGNSVTLGTITTAGTYIYHWTAASADVSVKATTSTGSTFTLTCLVTTPKTSTVIVTRRDCNYLWNRHEDIALHDIVHVNGDTQYQGTTWEGITLVNTLVPQSYSAYGDWDKETKGYAAKWSTLSDANKIKFITAKESHIYFDKDTNKYYQVKMGRGCIRGNGDGELLDTLAINGITKDTGSDKFLYKKGTDNVIPISLNQRLNQGTYDPTYNQFGCGARVSSNGGGWNSAWYGGRPVRRQREAFMYTGDSIETYPFPTGTVVGGGLMPDTRYINGSLESEDGFTSYGTAYSFYDALYAGLIQDYRTIIVQRDINAILHTEMRKDIQGETKGIGQIKYTKVFDSQAAAQNEGYTLGTMSGSLYVAHKFASPKFAVLPLVDIAASAARIKEVFPNGVDGAWMGYTPDGSNTVYQLTDKNIKSTLNWEALTSQWERGTTGIDVVNNSWTYPLASTNMGFWKYPSHAPHTVAVSASLPNIIDISDVLVTSDYRVNYGNCLMHSVTGIIGKDNANQPTYCTKTHYSDLLIKYLSDEFGAPANSSRKAAIVMSVVQKEGLLYVQYNAKVFEYVSGSWNGVTSISRVSDIIHHSKYPIGVLR